MHPVEVVEVQRGDGREQHDAGRVHHHVDAAEGSLGPLEGGPHRLLVGDVTADRDRGAPVGGDLLDHGVGLGPVARVVHGYRVAVRAEPLDDGRTDAAGAAGHEGYATVGRSGAHGSSLHSSK